MFLPPAHPAVKSQGAKIKILCLILFRSTLRVNKCGAETETTLPVDMTASRSLLQ
jgi:hypothetical protein